MGHRIAAAKMPDIFHFPFLRQLFFSGNSPEVVYRGFQNPFHPCNKHGATIGLDTRGCAVFTVHMYFSVNSGFLRVAHDNISYSSVPEFYYSQCGILHLDIRMIQVSPDAVNFFHLSHKPKQDIQLVWRLIYQDSSSFRFPVSPPFIGIVIAFVSPTQHVNGTQYRFTYLAGLNGFFHPQYGFIPSALTDYSKLDSRLFTG
ncbi:hypothetical protein SDC9_136226 [bioreactor metagenome]|uniref:Uncharacterized protein n=1 Tax=bioreactor metagenome TaxID=1076179 RepID=A0A645DJA3_9ZZZZ